MVSFHLHQYASLGKWSVLRVWDVLLFEGNRVMLFRTALGVLCAMVSFHLHQYASLGKWSVLRVWDVLLFEGNRVMLFRTALGVLCQLVFTACMGYQDLNESRLQELRSKHRPAVMAAFEERLKRLERPRNQII
ncbi:hypothetical protein F2Q69_00032728 [Brassica cretica]|uniref:Rab-GAP TBC domain-containing protein n=1 Tax=Brassica cretica TaxID=69181 RepID=A0A8S9SBM5_BRACR|nr:hypothetical protein F2Q69_00032728 [Brassica cretica]